MNKLTCIIEDCTAPIQARKMCASHWARDYRERNPDKHQADLAKRKARNAARAASNPTLICVLCKTPLLNYMPGRMGDRPMHKACREIAPRYMITGEPSPRRAKAMRLVERAARGTSGSGAWTNGNCPWCGKDFTRMRAKWCSRTCRSAARIKAQHPFAFMPTPNDRASVLERDSWTCQLCAMPIDSTLHYLDAWSATLDHVIPQSSMLVPDHSEGNLRAAHRWCNSARGDGTNMSASEVVSRAHAMLAA